MDKIKNLILNVYYDLMSNLLISVIVSVVFICFLLSIMSMVLAAGILALLTFSLSAQEMKMSWSDQVLFDNKKDGFFKLFGSWLKYLTN